MNEPRPKRFPLSLDKVATGVARAQPVRELLRPQAPLQQAEQDRRRLASPAATPAGLGMDSRAVQQRMVERLMADGIRHPGLLQAFATIPRHWFVDSALVNQAYEDTSLPSGWGRPFPSPR